MQLKPLGTVFYLLVIFPGTHLYRHARKKAFRDDPDMNHYINICNSQEQHHER